MEEIETLNGSCSYEQTGDKLADLTTITSLKSSLASVFRASYPKPKLIKASSISIIKSDYSIELNQDDVDEYCERKTVANFQKSYLELGQWPEVPAPKFQAFKAKYQEMKKKLNLCKNERNRTRDLIKRYESGKFPCRNCEVLKVKNAKTKLAL